MVALRKEYTGVATGQRDGGRGGGGDEAEAVHVESVDGSVT